MCPHFMEALLKVSTLFIAFLGDVLRLYTLIDIFALEEVDQVFLADVGSVV